MAYNVPIVDFSGFAGTGTSRDKEIGHALVAGLRESGFAILKNTRVTAAETDEMLEHSKRFFALPYEEKDKIRHPPDPANHVGWSAVETENLNLDKDTTVEEAKERRKKAPDYKESLEVWKSDHPTLHNLFPPEKELPGFKKVAETFWTKMQRLSQDVLKAVALGLDLQVDFFDWHHEGQTCQQRLLHYPSAPREWFSNGVYVPMNAHTDFCTGTLLIQDDVGGLEVENPNKPGSFIEVPPTQGGIVFNVADLLQRWTNDVLKSGRHRVVVKPPRPNEDQSKTADRYSLPFFISADWEKEVACMPLGNKPPQYEPVKAGEYILGRMATMY